MKKLRIFRTATVSAIALAASLSAAVAEDHHNRAFWLVNNTDQVVEYVHISHIGTTEWGGDLLGSEVLASGDKIALEPFWNDGYCRFDIKVVYANNDEQIIGDVNLCQVGKVEVVDRTYEAYTS